MRILRMALALGLGLLVACLDFSKFEPRPGPAVDAGCATGRVTCGTRAEDICATPLGTAQDCAACGDVCGSYCATDHCVGPVQLRLGRTFSCARLADGTVGCWGDNSFSELGADVSVVTRPKPDLVPGVHDATALALGNSFGCVLTARGTVECWGRNLEGELGDGTVLNRPDPRAVVGVEGAVEVACGHGHACARMDGGALWCWGNNSNGQLGNGLTGASYTPTPVLGLPTTTSTVQLALGRQSSCARMQSGEVFCWGRNQAGQVGDGTLTQRTAAVKVTGLMDAVDLSAGANDFCAVRDGGFPVCWGDNGNGELAQPPDTVPYRATVSGIGNGLNKMGHIEVADSTVCNVRSDDTLFCWGANDGGEVGNGTVNTPVTIPTGLGGQNVSEFAGGAWHFCLRSPSDVIRCWGDNSLGQLGQPLSVPLATRPTAVTW